MSHRYARARPDRELSLPELLADPIGRDRLGFGQEQGVDVGFEGVQAQALEDGGRYST